MFGAEDMTNPRKPGTIHLFIDTNVFLRFFAYSKDDLQQLEKLLNLVRLRTVKLYLTQQVVDEFYRNREAKLAESLKTFGEYTISPVPTFMLALEEYSQFRAHLKAFEKGHASLLERAQADAEAGTLPADEIFGRLKVLAQLISYDDKSLAAADRRSRLGNPPGKPGSVGDQFNWEILLANVPMRADLHVLSQDGDYASKLNSGSPKSFLRDEWSGRKEGGLYTYEQLSQFFTERFPSEDFSLAIEKRQTIDSLVESGSFSGTHSAVARLEPYISSLTDDEVNEVALASLANNQVSWIMGDPDVSRFFKRLLDEHRDAIPETLKNLLETSLPKDTA